MKLDMVHDLQQVYRVLLEAMARPGTIGQLSEQADRIGMEVPTYPATFLLGMLLLDAETTFHICSSGPTGGQWTELLRQLAYTRPEEMETADFIMVLSDASPAQRDAALQRAKAGSLADPHRSATVIIETERLEYGDELLLKGPGIESELSVRLATDSEWLAIRERRNREYPLGIDLIVVDREHRVLCLPRTTQIGYRTVS